MYVEVDEQLTDAIMKISKEATSALCSHNAELKIASSDDLRI